MNQETTQNPEAELESTTESTTEEDIVIDPMETPLETTITPEVSGDPIDSLSAQELKTILASKDISYLNKNLTEDEMRHALKKERSVSQRKEKKVETPPVTTGNPYMTKKDFEMSNQKKAVMMAKEDTEITKDFFDVLPQWYVNRNGRDTHEGILKDIKVAHKSWKANKEEETPNPTADLTATTVSSPSGSKETSPSKKVDDFWGEQKDLKDIWYPTSKK